MKRQSPAAGKRLPRVTAADVAEIAGVSRSAVSRAFTEGAYLDQEKRERILLAAHELGYQPNALAATLQGARSNLVAVFAGEMRNEYDKEATSALIAGLNAAGKWPVVIAGSGDHARDAVTQVLRYPLDAMILRSGSLATEIVDLCSKLHIPVIASGRIIDAERVDNICLRNHQAAMLAADLFAKRGRQRVALVGGPDDFGATAERRNGLLDGLTKHQLTLAGEIKGNYTTESGYFATQRLLEQANFDGIFCANDAMAIGALGALKDAGRLVSQDISVIGFDDIEMARWPTIRLTTLRNPIADMVTAVLCCLDRRLDHPQAQEETVLLDAEIILRDTH
ncbi:LacI family DNA-binding transcriptional regulator [Phaeobacter inhibens]|uniref:LacI family DNA-binding transcriptional regulator n=1 Tax=Phaeobacter inhibens TaxID=221822 RepID=UPI0021A8C218|nr:LacI family DNA-binding transcriptional regulator [Phaeobacter inhibens]UWR60976.1 LacI family DNA-binding transcriptional regulator [Phaeobacter inhibens]